MAEKLIVWDGTDLAGAEASRGRSASDVQLEGASALQTTTDELARTHMDIVETRMSPFQDALTGAHSSPASLPGTHDGATVLIVEDDDCIADLLVELLSDEGYRVIVAQDGIEALSMASHEHPDMILSDCMMPRLSGTQLAAQLRHRPETRAIPIALMSSNRPRGLSLAGVPFLAKPFEIDDVLDLVAQCTRTPTLARLAGEG